MRTHTHSIQLKQRFKGWPVYHKPVLFDIWLNIITANQQSKMLSVGSCCLWIISLSVDRQHIINRNKMFTRPQFMSTINRLYTSTTIVFTTSHTGQLVISMVNAKMHFALCESVTVYIQHPLWTCTVKKTELKTIDITYFSQCIKILYYIRNHYSILLWRHHFYQTEIIPLYVPPIFEEISKNFRFLELTVHFA